jgi:hypothetical protein
MYQRSFLQLFMGYDLTCQNQALISEQSIMHFKVLADQTSVHSNWNHLLDRRHKTFQKPLTREALKGQSLFWKSSTVQIQRKQMAGKDQSSNLGTIHIQFPWKHLQEQGLLLWA